MTVRMDGETVRATSEMLARAFHDDPPVVWMFPNEEKRRKASLSDFRMVIKYGLRYGEVYSTDGSNEGAAVWLPAEAPLTSTLRAMRVAFWDMASTPFRVGFGFLPRFLAAMSTMENLHKKDAPKRHRYLMVLGVEPERQGQGVGGALLQPGLEKADRERVPCYLETAKEINVTFYEKNGFEVVQKVDLPRGGPPVWTMLREPIG